MNEDYLTSSLLDQLDERELDVRSAMCDSEDAPFILMYPKGSLYDILIESRDSSQIIILADFPNLTPANKLLEKCKKILERLKMIPSIDDFTQPVIIRSLFGSYNFCSLSPNDSYSDFFRYPSAVEYAFRTYTFAIGVVPDCRSFYNVIRLLYSLVSVFESRKTVKLVIPKLDVQNKKFDYAVNLNTGFLRDIELYASDNRFRNLEHFPYKRLFEYMTRKYKETWSHGELKKAIEHNATFVDRCQGRDDENEY